MPAPDPIIWTVIVTLLLPHHSVFAARRDCLSLACVNETRDLAMKDPMAGHFQVWNPENPYYPMEGASPRGVTSPDEDVWLQ